MNLNNTMIKSEETDKVLLRPGTLYAWTIAPNDKCQCLGVERPKMGNTRRTRLDSVYRSFSKVLTEMEISNIEYILNVEISEPFSGSSNGQIPRIHYHGYLYFPDCDSILEFLQYDAVTLSTKCLQTIKQIFIEDDGTCKWDAYMEKQQFLNIPPIKSNYHGSITTQIKSHKSKNERGENKKHKRNALECPQSSKKDDVGIIQTKAVDECDQPHPCEDSVSKPKRIKYKKRKNP